MSSENTNKVVVKIFGDEYPISGVADPSYISRVADYVDTIMKETAKASQIKVKDKVAILAAMSIASELEEKNDQLNRLTSKFESKIDEMNDRLDAVLADFS